MVPVLNFALVYVNFASTTVNFAKFCTNSIIHGLNCTRQQRRPRRPSRPRRVVTSFGESVMSHGWSRLLVSRLAVVHNRRAAPRCRGLARWRGSRGAVRRHDGAAGAAVMVLRHDGAWLSHPVHAATSPRQPHPDGAVAPLPAQYTLATSARATSPPIPRRCRPRSPRCRATQRTTRRR